MTSLDSADDQPRLTSADRAAGGCMEAMTGLRGNGVENTMTDGYVSR